MICPPKPDRDWWDNSEIWISSAYVNILLFEDIKSFNLHGTLRNYLWSAAPHVMCSHLMETNEACKAISQKYFGN